MPRAIRTQAAKRLMTVLPLLLALVVGAMLRIELTLTAPPFLVANDSAEYFSAGYNLLTSGDLQLSVKRTPLYAIFLAGLTGAVGPSLDRLVLVQHALGLLTIVLAYLLGRLAFGPLAASVAALGVAVNGALLMMEHLIISEALFTPLLLASLVAVLAAHQRRHMALWLLAGLLLGLDAVCRPLGIAVLGVVLGMLPAAGLPRPALLRAAGPLLLGAAICVVPWIVRQTMVHERAVVNGGLGDALYSRVRRYDSTFTLQDGGSSGPAIAWANRARIVEMAPLYEYPREVRAALRAEFGVDDSEADRQLQAVALSTIAHDPTRYLLGTLGMSSRLARGYVPSLIDLWQSVQRDRVLQGWPPDLLWALTTDRLTDDPAPFTRVQAILAFSRDDLPSGSAPLALAPLGAAWALMARRRAGAGVIPLVILTQILLYVALDGPLYRYRLSLQPLITLLGAAGLALVLQQIAVIWKLSCQMAAGESAVPGPTELHVAPASIPARAFGDALHTSREGDQNSRRSSGSGVYPAPPHG